MDRLGQSGERRQGSAVLDLSRTEPMHGDNAGGKTFHIPGINLPWRAGSVDRPVGGTMTPKFKGRKRNKNDFSWPDDEHEGRSIPVAPIDVLDTGHKVGFSWLSPILQI